MKGNLATIKAIDILVWIGIFYLSAIAGYTIANIAPAGNVWTHSLEHTPPTELSSHSHPDTFASTDVNTQPPPNSTLKPTTTNSPQSPLIAEVTTSIVTNGMIPVFYKVETKQPVVFLTIDDGVVKDDAAITFMQQHHLLASLFLNDSKISDNYDYFKILQSAGNDIENHTVNHLNLTKLTYYQQKKEICDNADKFATVFGKRPTLFRPPYGAFNDITRQAAADCGMTALIHWHAKANNGSVQYQQGEKLQPGDIVLMHFRKEVIADLTAFDQAAQKAKLKTALLEDWIK